MKRDFFRNPFVFFLSLKIKKRERSLFISIFTSILTFFSLMLILGQDIKNIKKDSFYSSDSPEVAGVATQNSIPTPTSKSSAIKNSSVLTGTPVSSSTPTPANSSTSTPTGTPTPMPVSTPTPTPASSNCETDCLTNLRNVLLANKPETLYLNLSSEYRDSFTLEEFTASATGSAIVSVTASSCTQTASDWCETATLIIQADGTTAKYNIILHKEDNSWKIYGTEEIP